MFLISNLELRITVITYCFQVCGVCTLGIQRSVVNCFRLRWEKSFTGTGMTLLVIVFWKHGLMVRKCITWSFYTIPLLSRAFGTCRKSFIGRWLTISYHNVVDSPVNDIFLILDNSVTSYLIMKSILIHSGWKVPIYISYVRELLPQFVISGLALNLGTYLSGSSSSAT